MTDMPLVVIVPSRGRPEAVARVARAWDDTGAWQAAELRFVIDVDDPRFAEYERALSDLRIRRLSIPQWLPLVPKLNDAAILYARHFGFRYLAFAGDDHLPRTPGWAQDMTAALDAMGTGIVYPNDGYQGEKLASTWAMTRDIVHALGRMVPAPVDHLYCDNSVMDLGRAVGRLAYLPDILIEHMHPVARKAPTDEQYERVNGSDQYRKDRPAYKRWRSGGGLQRDARAVAALIEGSAHG